MLCLFYVLVLLKPICISFCLNLKLYLTVLLNTATSHGVILTSVNQKMVLNKKCSILVMQQLGYLWEIKMKDKMYYAGNALKH